MNVNNLTPVVKDPGSLGIHILHYKGDITELKCDAIVSSTNSMMQQSMGVHGKICRLGGIDFEQNLKNLRESFTSDERGARVGLKSGTSAICKAGGKLHCKFVIMTNSPGVTRLNELKNVRNFTFEDPQLYLIPDPL